MKQPFIPLFSYFATDPKLYHQTTVPIPGFIQYGNSSYSLISSKKDWEEAHKNCKAEHSELASILDAYTQSFLWLHMLKFKEPVWIGLNSNVVNMSNILHVRILLPHLSPDDWLSWFSRTVTVVPFRLIVGTKHEQEFFVFIEKLRWKRASRYHLVQPGIEPVTLLLLARCSNQLSF